MAAVAAVLEEIGAAGVPQIVVWNKIDLTGVEPGMERDDCGNIARVRVSARSGAGLDILREALAEVARDHAREARAATATEAASAN
jgi:GTP-binding protein HflX